MTIDSDSHERDNSELLSNTTKEKFSVFAADTYGVRDMRLTSDETWKKVRLIREVKK